MLVGKTCWHLNLFSKIFNVSLTCVEFDGKAKMRTFSFLHLTDICYIRQIFTTFDWFSCYMTLLSVSAVMWVGSSSVFVMYIGWTPFSLPGSIIYRCNIRNTGNIRNIIWAMYAILVICGIYGIYVENTHVSVLDAYRPPHPQDR